MAAFHPNTGPALTSPNPVGDSGIYLLQTRVLFAPSSLIPGVDLGRLAPLAANTVLSGLAPHTESTSLVGLEPPAESIVFGGLVPRTGHANLGWDHGHLYRISRFSHTQATYKD